MKVRALVLFLVAVVICFVALAPADAAPRKAKAKPGDVVRLEVTEPTVQTVQRVTSNMASCGVDFIISDNRGNLCVGSSCSGGCEALDCVFANGQEIHEISGCGTN